MRILRISVILLFALTLCVYIYFSIADLSADRTMPSITLSSDTIEVPLNASTEDFLNGVTAYDEKDGNITDKVIVESISRFTQPGVAIVTYAVCDSDSHVASATRTVKYTGYDSPRFTLNDSLVFGLSESVKILDRLGASDMIDGDISDKVIITATNFTDNVTGVFQISAKAANSRGDTIYLNLPVYVEERSISAPEITLLSHLVYTTEAEPVDPAANLVSAKAQDGTDLTASVQMDTNYNPTSPGIYEVHYYASDAQGRRGHEILTIIVEED